jgi:hypothetical protein
MAGHNRGIFPERFVSPKRLAQVTAYPRVLCEHQEAGSPPIEPLHDDRHLSMPVPREILADRINQCVGFTAIGRNGQDVGCLINHNQIPILENDPEHAL